MKIWKFFDKNYGSKSGTKSTVPNNVWPDPKTDPEHCLNADLRCSKPVRTEILTLK
jgi:hypothetical protein